MRRSIAAASGRSGAEPAVERPLRWGRVPAEMGDLGVAVDDAGVCAVSFRGPGGPIEERPDGVLADAVAQLRAYLAGELTEFDLPFVVRGGSDFERAVWTEIAGIPYAEMRTYGELAAAVRATVTEGVLVAETDPTGARAVGSACNHNPLPVIVPCHRVVGAGGKLVGFGGGLPRKRFLLELEARVRIVRDFGGGQSSP